MNGYKEVVREFVEGIMNKASGFEMSVIPPFGGTVCLR